MSIGELVGIVIDDRFTQGEEVEVAIYNCPWYSAPHDFTDMILMFLMRSQQPTLMQGEPFYKLKLTLIARVSMDYIDIYKYSHTFTKWIHNIFFR